MSLTFIIKDVVQAHIDEALVENHDQPQPVLSRTGGVRLSTKREREHKRDHKDCQ